MEGRVFNTIRASLRTSCGHSGKLYRVPLRWRRYIINARANYRALSGRTGWFTLTPSPGTAVGKCSSSGCAMKWLETDLRLSACVTRGRAYWHQPSCAATHSGSDASTFGKAATSEPPPCAISGRPPPLPPSSPAKYLITSPALTRSVVSEVTPATSAISPLQQQRAGSRLVQACSCTDPRCRAASRQLRRQFGRQGL